MLLKLLTLSAGSWPPSNLSTATNYPMYVFPSPGLGCALEKPSCTPSRFLPAQDPVADQQMSQGSPDPFLLAWSAARLRH